MAFLRSFSRRSLYSKWFCCKTSRPYVLHHHIKEDCTESSFPDSSLVIRRQLFFQGRTKMSFVDSSGVLLCRHMSSSSTKPEELFSKIDAFGNVVEELVSEKSVEAIATNVSTIDCVQYVINGIHELTGFNWWMSIVLTTFLVHGLMSPVSLRLQRQAWELQVLGKNLEKLKTIIQTDDPKALGRYKTWEARIMQKLGEASLSFLNLGTLHAFICISFVDGISAMAKQTPSFENGGIFWFTDLSTPESFYLLPLATGVTFWLTSKGPINRANLISRMRSLPLFLIIVIALQVTYNYEPAVYLYLIPSRIYIFTLFMMLRSKQIVKLRRSLGWLNLPVTRVSEQQRIMARLISLMRELIGVVKTKDKK